jgi:flagellar protein FliO/FliZ
MIHILETATLGPKRALVVAKIGGETMILGASEAGITLLRAVGATDQPVLTAPLVAAVAADEEIKIDESLPGEGAEQAGLLARLFRRQPTDDGVSPDVKPGDWREFDDLLQESMEDQELRRRLSLGIGGKVS